jgi:2-keto-4-pentenoate hydratase/2-oxohepta-3-ene-1,7-dioic acid hydratase in catechol pathway
MKIICIGRNYADHAKEMKSELPTEPIFFMKPDTALVKEGSDIYLPEFSNEIHFECEVVIKINKAGKFIQKEFARNYYSEITLGLDLTARDLQTKCKEKGLPWELAKAFDNSAPISSKWISISDINLSDINFQFFQNGELKQNGFTKDMIFSVDELISYVSKFITLKTGDLIYTGTPAGVGPIQIGDKLEGNLNGNKLFEFTVK